MVNIFIPFSVFVNILTFPSSVCSFFSVFAQIKQLSKLVASFKAGQGFVDWTTIGSFMSRAPESCRDKWSSLVHDEVPLGPYSAEEDALILRRVEEWGDRGNGLWVSLQNEMGRSSSSLNGRWRTLKKRKGRGTVLP